MNVFRPLSRGVPTPPRPSKRRKENTVELSITAGIRCVLPDPTSESTLRISVAAGCPTDPSPSTTPRKNIDESRVAFGKRGTPINAAHALPPHRVCAGSREVRGEALPKAGEALRLHDVRQGLYRGPVLQRRSVRARRLALHPSLGRVLPAVATNYRPSTGTDIWRSAG